MIIIEFITFHVVQILITSVRNALAIPVKHIKHLLQVLPLYEVLEILIHCLP